MAMNEVVTVASNEALSRGYTVSEAQTASGKPVYQIFDAEGNYVCSGVTPEQAWTRAFRRGQLGELANNGRKIRD